MNSTSVFYRPLFKNYYYAFVCFSTIDDAKRVIEQHRYPRLVEGSISRALPYMTAARRAEYGNQHDIQNNSIFVKGFEKANWNHEDLYAKFCSYGKIISCKVSVLDDFKFLGHGFIQFSKMEEA